MLLRVPEVLSPDALARCRAIMEEADWADGKITAGTQSEQVKNNRQLPEDSEAARTARAIVLDALGRSALFITGALPKKTYPPLFNRYDGTSNAFGNHIDNSVRTSPITGAWVRTDLSATLFLSEPEEYDGGELVIEDTFGSQSVKLAAGDLILYPASSVHRVDAAELGPRDVIGGPEDEIDDLGGGVNDAQGVGLLAEAEFEELLVKLGNDPLLALSVVDTGRAHPHGLVEAGELLGLGVQALAFEGGGHGVHDDGDRVVGGEVVALEQGVEDRFGDQVLGEHRDRRVRVDAVVEVLP